MKEFTADATIREIAIHHVNEGFFHALRDQLSQARTNPGRSEVGGVRMFAPDVLPLLRLIGDPASSAVPEYMEPEWLAEIDAILLRVGKKLFPDDGSTP
jgi:hypothetical protein